MTSRMKDVAERAGVSVTTVSHVVNKTRQVAPETRRRVLEVIRDTNFYKNVHARRLARGGSDFFGLIVSDIGNPFFPEIIKSFETAALDRGFDLLLCNTNYDPHRTQAAVRKMIENKVRGVAVMTSELGTAPGGGAGGTSRGRGFPGSRACPNSNEQYPGGLFKGNFSGHQPSARPQP